MTDPLKALVEKLRAEANTDETSSYFIRKLLTEAADAIAALRSQPQVGKCGVCRTGSVRVMFDNSHRCEWCGAIHQLSDGTSPDNPVARFKPRAPKGPFVVLRCTDGKWTPYFFESDEAARIAYTQMQAQWSDVAYFTPLLGCGEMKPGSIPMSASPALPQPQAPTRERVMDVIRAADNNGKPLWIGEAADAVLALYADAAPAQPICKHGETKPHVMKTVTYGCMEEVDVWCPGPVAAPQERPDYDNAVPCSGHPSQPHRWAVKDGKTYCTRSA